MQGPCSPDTGGGKAKEWKDQRSGLLDDCLSAFLPPPPPGACSLDNSLCAQSDFKFGQWIVISFQGLSFCLFFLKDPNRPLSPLHFATFG